MIKILNCKSSTYYILIAGGVNYFGIAFNFEDDDSLRFSIVSLATFALGVLDRERAIKAKNWKKAGQLELALRNQFLMMVDNPEAFKDMSSKYLIDELLTGTAIIDIRKINYEDIKDFIETQIKVMRSL